MLGSPAKFSKTVLLSSDLELNKTLLFVLSYFTRCSLVYQNTLKQSDDEIKPIVVISSEDEPMKRSEISDFLVKKHMNESSSSTLVNVKESDQESDSFEFPFGFQFTSEKPNIKECNEDSCSDGSTNAANTVFSENITSNVSNLTSGFERATSCLLGAIGGFSESFGSNFSAKPEEDLSVVETKTFTKMKV